MIEDSTVQSLVWCSERGQGYDSTLTYLIRHMGYCQWLITLRLDMTKLLGCGQGQDFASSPSLPGTEYVIDQATCSGLRIHSWNSNKPYQLPLRCTTTLHRVNMASLSLPLHKHLGCISFRNNYLRLGTVVNHVTPSTTLECVCQCFDDLAIWKRKHI